MIVSNILVLLIFIFLAKALSQKQMNNHFKSVKLLLAQSINIPATKQFFRIFMKPQLFVPQQIFESVMSIDTQRLQSMKLIFIKTYDTEH